MTYWGIVIGVSIIFALAVAAVVVEFQSLTTKKKNQRENQALLREIKKRNLEDTQ